MIFIMSTIIVGLVVLACLGIAAKHIYKLFKGETSCCGTEAPRVSEKKLVGPMTSTARPRKSISIATRQR